MAEAVNERVNLVQKLATLDEHWKPHVVAMLNDYEVIAVKVQGEFVWHEHPRRRRAPDSGTRADQRADGRIAERWAIRDDLAMINQLRLPRPQRRMTQTPIARGDRGLLAP